MFTWICPKCGKEVPPAYSECPNCAANEQTAPAGEAPAQAPPPAPAAAPPPAARRAERSTRVPGWMLSILFAAGFVLTLAVAFLAYNSIKKPDRPAAAAAPLNAPAVPQAPTVQTNPAFRNVELAGLRLTEDKQKASLQFIVVNHSPADLGEISAKVNLKAISAKQEQESVGTFSFKTSLGPYEAKDLKAAVETKLRVYELPDWQFLRAEIAP